MPEEYLWTRTVVVHTGAGQMVVDAFEAKGMFGIRVLERSVVPVDQFYVIEDERIEDPIAIAWPDAAWPHRNESIRRQADLLAWARSLPIADQEPRSFVRIEGI